MCQNERGISLSKKVYLYLQIEYSNNHCVKTNTEYLYQKKNIYIYIWNTVKNIVSKQTRNIFIKERISIFTNGIQLKSLCQNEHGISVSKKVYLYLQIEYS